MTNPIDQMIEEAAGNHANKQWRSVIEQTGTGQSNWRDSRSDYKAGAQWMRSHYEQKLKIAVEALGNIRNGNCVLTNSRPIKDGCHCLACTARQALKELENVQM